VEGAYRVLGGAPSAVVTATLEDAMAVEERPNMPGTTSEWPNWCIALPQSLDQLEEATLAEAIGKSLERRDGWRSRPA
jgi:4-alpha-glucanotransferase